MTFPAGTNPSDVVSVYPTQLFEVAMGMIMFGILWRIRDHEHAEGWLFGVWAVLAGVERFIVEFFRAKDDRLSWTMGLSMAQVIALGMIAIGFAVMMARRQPGPNRPGIHHARPPRPSVSGSLTALHPTRERAGESPIASRRSFRRAAPSALRP